MSTAIFEKGNIYTPLLPKEDGNGKVWIKARAHTTLTAKTPYKITLDEYGYVTAALSTTTGPCYIGVPDSAITSGTEGWVQIGGYCEDIITPSLSVGVGHALYVAGTVVGDKGADYTGDGSEFAICAVASTSSTTQDAVLVPRMLSVTTVNGTSSNPYVDDTADVKFISEYFSNGAATGTARGQYTRLYLTGGAGGEALRIFTTQSSNTPADTTNGAHITLSFGASAGGCTGLGTAVRATLQIPNRSTLAGTMTAVQAEIWAEGASSAVHASNILSAMRISVGGNATGITAITRAATAVAFHFDAGCVDTTAGIIDSDRTSNTAAGCIKIYIDGVGTRWITYGTGS